jgi:hypothetical protein
MNNQEKIKEDILREFIYPERIEKAPEGFTSKVMTLIQMESIPLKNSEKSRNRNIIPYLSVAITLLLIIATFLIPADKSGSFSLILLEQIKNIKITLPAFDLNSIFNFSLPAIILYVIIGIIVLTLFDLALSGIFHREK